MSARSKETRGHIDWSSVRARLEQAAAATEEALNPSAKRAKEIMDNRARALAQVPAPARPADAYLDVVLFGLGKERYAIETRLVREVARLSDFTPIPGTPDFVLGITNLRGAVVAIIDSHRFFGIPRNGVTDLSRLIVLGTVRREFGILADETYGQAEIAADEILPPPGDVSGIGRGYIRGVTSEALIILDGTELLGDQRLIVGNREGSGA